MANCSAGESTGWPKGKRGACKWWRWGVALPCGVFMATSLRTVDAGSAKWRALRCHRRDRRVGGGGRFAGAVRCRRRTRRRFHRRVGVADLALHVVDQPLAVVHLHIDVALVVEIAVRVFPRLDPQTQDAGLRTQRTGCRAVIDIAGGCRYGGPDSICGRSW